MKLETFIVVVVNNTLKLFAMNGVLRIELLQNFDELMRATFNLLRNLHGVLELVDEV